MIIGRGAVDVNGVATINRPRQSSNSKGFVHVALSPQGRGLGEGTITRPQETTRASTTPPSPLPSPCEGEGVFSAG